MRNYSSTILIGLNDFRLWNKSWLTDVIILLTLFIHSVYSWHSLFYIYFRCIAQWLGMYAIYEMFPPIIPVPTGTIQSHYNIIDCIPCTLHPRDCFLTTDLYFLIPLPLSLGSLIPLPPGNHQFVLCRYVCFCVV